MSDSADYPVLRHALAALAYRTQKAVRAAGPSFAGCSPGHGVRTPQELVRHMESVIGYAVTFFDPVERRFQAEPRATFTEQIAAFSERLAELAARLEAGAAMHRGLTATRLLQGPIADAITHAGQLALLRRLADDPIPPENFIFADISPERLGDVQSPAVRPGNSRGAWPDAPGGPRILATPPSP